MSIEAMKAAFAVEDISSTDKLLLLALGNFADEAWTCFPAKATLEAMTNLSGRAVTLSLKRLEEAGYLLRQMRTRENGSSTSNRYTLHLGEGGAFRAPSHSDAPPPRRHVLPPGESVAPPEPSLEPSKELVRDARADFEIWWMIYPRRVAKAEALSAFLKCATLITFDALCIATRRFAEEVSDRPQEKIPHPATWLNGQRWEDEAGANRSSGHERGNGAATPSGLSRRAENALTGLMEAPDPRRRRWSV